MEDTVQQKRIKKWTVAGIVISWFTFWLFLLSPLGLTAWIVILVFLIIKRSNIKWYLIFSAWLFVPGCSFLTGSVAYFTGTGSLMSVGGPEIHHGIDSKTRLPINSSGCIVVGFEPFVFPANNVSVKLWTHLLGYQRGAYRGVLPSENEALDIIRNGDTIMVKREDDYYEFLIPTNPVRLKIDQNEELTFTVTFPNTVVGKLINDECFVFQQMSAENSRGWKTIYLVDVKHNKLLTKYHEY